MVQLRPNDPLAHYNLACSYALLKRTEQALKILRRAVEGKGHPCHPREAHRRRAAIDLRAAAENDTLHRMVPNMSRAQKWIVVAAVGVVGPHRRVQRHGRDRRGIFDNSDRLV